MKIIQLTDEAIKHMTTETLPEKVRTQYIDQVLQTIRAAIPHHAEWADNTISIDIGIAKEPK